ncbi:MAG: hypothetical protein M5U10_06685 [Candidatus Methanoperedens sp.]|nr:hypothetical protein [Candidatus Methanoperedens nitroreducens]MDJ1421584.1 hypothetical protein [Candidatus Methanoperedens sp.]
MRGEPSPGAYIAPANIPVSVLRINMLSKSRARNAKAVEHAATPNVPARTTRRAHMRSASQPVNITIRTYPA